MRERKDDIPPLTQFFASKYAPRGEQEITSEALSVLCSYHWPGNARELENVIEMAVILADGAPIRPPDLPVKISQAPPIEFALPSEQMTLDALEKRYIEQVYRQTGFHKSNTSSILGISRKTLDRKLKQYAIDKGE